jgi:hypothetical protein
LITNQKFLLHDVNFDDIIKLLRFFGGFVGIQSFNEQIFTDLTVVELEERFELASKGVALADCPVLGQQCPFDCYSNGAY